MFLTSSSVLKAALSSSLLAGLGAFLLYTLIASLVRFKYANKLPARFGFSLLYFLPIIALIISVEPYLAHADLSQAFIFSAVFIHFAKRVLECLFLHKYSSYSKFWGSAIISGLYSLSAFLIGTLSQTPPPLTYAWSAGGIILFLLGITGNFYYHKKLADFRVTSMDYVIPTGGLFNLIICPHYLFEFIGWVGIFMLSRHSGTLIVLAGMLVFLLVRSQITLKWYRDTFARFPANRKAMIPYIF